MSIKVTIDVEMELDEILYDDDLVEFILDFKFNPYLPYKGNQYEFLGVTVAEYRDDLVDEVEYWRDNYLDKIEDLRLGVYNEKFDSVDYTDITLGSIEDENLKKYLINEIKKELIDASL